MTHSLARVYWHTFVVLLLALATMGSVGFLLLTDVRQSQRQEHVTLTARHAASLVGATIAQQRHFIENIARQPDVVDAATRGKSPDRVRKGTDIQSLVPFSAAVHLLSTDMATGWAALPKPCLELAIHTLNFKSPPLDFHAGPDGTTHYDLLRPIVNTNQKTVGYLFAAVPVRPLQEALTTAMIDGGYAEISLQRGGESKPMVSAGDQGAASADGVAIELDDPPLTLSYWPPLARAVYYGHWFYYAVMALISTLLVMASLNVHRGTIRAVRNDIKSLARMFRDLRHGDLRRDYPMELGEFASVFQYLRDSGKKLMEEKEKFKDLGLLDHLSHLSNRRHFEMRLKELFELSKTHGPSSVLIIDLDHFKSVNDRYGHAAGDALIVEFSRALRAAVRASDFMARLGGDEFCIIYTYAHFDRAVACAERLRKQLPRELTLGSTVVHQLRWTGGLSTMAEHDTKFDDVLWRADQALIQAKVEGRNILKTCHADTGLAPRKHVAST